MAIDISDMICIEENVVRSKFEVTVDASDSVPAAVFRSLRKKDDKKVLIDAASGRWWTGRSLSVAVKQAIRVWSKVMGLVKGETVAFYCPNSDWHAVHLLAVSALGGIYAGGNDTYKLRE